MILSSHGIIANSIASGDPDWTAYYNRVIAAGGSLTLTEQNATKTLVADLKAAGIWTLQKAIYPMVGASAAACAQNLKSSSFTGTFSGGWTFASTGITPNGTTGYMDTGLNPLTVFGTNFSHQSFYSRSSKTSGTIIQGCTGATRFDMGYDGGANTPFVAFGSGNSDLGSDTSTLGFVLSYRTSSTAGKMKRNDTTKATVTQTFSVYPSFNYWLAARNPALFLNVFEYAFASVGDTMTDINATDFNTAMTTFQTTLGRQV